MIFVWFEIRKAGRREQVSYPPSVLEAAQRMKDGMAATVADAFNAAAAAAVSLQGCRSGKLRAVRLNQRGDIRTIREWVDAWMDQKQREEHVM